MGQYPGMRRNKRGPVTVLVLAGVLSLTLVMRLIGRTPHAQAPRHPSTATPKELAHPFIPSPQVVKPAVAPCRARDLHDLVAAIRQSEKNLAPTLKKQNEDGAPVACRGDADSGPPSSTSSPRTPAAAWRATASSTASGIWFSRR
jgi:hypothetical protein